MKPRTCKRYQHLSGFKGVAMYFFSLWLPWELIDPGTCAVYYNPNLLPAQDAVYVEADKEECSDDNWLQKKSKIILNTI